MRATRLARLAAFFSSAGRLRASSADQPTRRPAAPPGCRTARRTRAECCAGARSCGRRSQRDHGGARALQESFAVFVRDAAPAARRSAPCTPSAPAAARPSAGCDAGCRDTPESVPPSGNSPAEPKQAAAETRRHRAGAARAFGKDDQRITLAQRGAQRLERIDGRVLARAIDEHRAAARAWRCSLRSPCPSSRAPRPAGCAGAARAAARTRWPACRCGWCDWRSRCAGDPARVRADPARVGADQQLDDADQQRARGSHQRAFNCAAMARMRVPQVTMAPRR